MNQSSSKRDTLFLPVLKLVQRRSKYSRKTEHVAGRFQLVMRYVGRRAVEFGEVEQHFANGKPWDTLRRWRKPNRSANGPRMDCRSCENRRPMRTRNRASASR